MQPLRYCFRVILLLSFVFSVQRLQAQTQTLSAWVDQIAAINKKMSLGFTSADAALVTKALDSDALCMPEYQPTLTGVANISQYYQMLFSRLIFLYYEKNTLETFHAKDRIVEVGQLRMSYRVKDSTTTITLTGKYMQVWAVQQDKSLRLRALADGYFKNVEQPSIWVATSSQSVAQNPIANKSLAHQLRAMNTLMEEAVRTRDGNLRADFFSDDAAFMPFADTTKTTMQVLRPYMVQYNSYPVTIDSINIYNMGAEDLGTYIIEYPLFRVKWHNNDGSGSGSGKGIRLWRREKDCSLKIFREIGLHNYPE